MEEDDMVVIMLKSLPRAYEHFIETLNITATDVYLKFGELCNKLLQQDGWKKQFGSNTETEGSEQAFAANFKGKGKGAKKKGQHSGEDGSQGQKTICHYCGNTGHMKKHCRKQFADQKTNQGGPQQKAHVIEHTEEESVFYAFMATTQADHDQSRSSAWYIDSGASRHFTNRTDWFTEYVSCSSKDSVIFGGGEEYTVVGKRNVQISLWREYADVPQCLLCARC